MRFSEIARLQDYMRKTFDNNPDQHPDALEVRRPGRGLHRRRVHGVCPGRGRGEISYSFIMTILDIDLPSNADI